MSSLMTRRFMATAIAAGLCLCVSNSAWALLSSISMDMTNFTGDDLLGRATFVQDGNDIQVTLTLVQEAGYVNTGDWCGFWFNVSDDSVLPGLSVAGADVTAYDFSGNVDWVGSANNNLNGGGSPGLMDAGIAFGRPGAAGGLLETTTFTLSHTSGLTLSLFDGQTIAGRVQSVGPAPEGGDGSSKIVNGDDPIPEPVTAGLTMMSLSALAVAIRRRR